MTKHDYDCVGCETRRTAEEEGGVLVMDYLAYCDKCGTSIQGCYEHRIRNVVYCTAGADNLVIFPGQ